MRKLIAIVFLGLVCTFTPKSEAQVVTIGNQCSRPGPINDNNCTVLYRVANNPPNNKVCLWIKDTNGLAACEGRTLWGAGYDWIPPSGVTLEFRTHATWPTQNPQFLTNPGAVRVSGQLLKSQFVTSRHRASPATSCDITIEVGQSIQAAINSSGVSKTVCLAAGIHSVSSTIRPKSGQTLRSASSGSRATLRAVTDDSMISIEESGITVKWLNLEGSVNALPTFGVIAQGASNLLLDGLDITKTLIGFGVTSNSDNIEMRESQVRYTGDGIRPGADPAVWVNSSSDVRIIKSMIINNGNSPEGDGEVACYNSPNLVMHNTVVSHSGAAGMYLVNCDYAVVSGNEISHAGEWGLDLVDTNAPSGSDYGLFSWNLIQHSRHGAGVVKNSKNNTFQNNDYISNRAGPNASGSCNGINRRGNTSGYYYINDVASPWPVVCND